MGITKWTAYLDWIAQTWKNMFTILREKSIDFLGQRSTVTVTVSIYWNNLVNTILCIFIKLCIYDKYDERMNPIEFGGQGQGYNGRTRTVPCEYDRDQTVHIFSKKSHLLPIMIEWTLLIFKVMLLMSRSLANVGCTGILCFAVSDWISAHNNSKLKSNWLNWILFGKQHVQACTKWRQ